MSRPFKYAGRGKRDSTHKAIAEALTKAGWKVTDLSMVGGGCPDMLALAPALPMHTNADGLLTWRFSLPLLIEVKSHRGAKLTSAQQEFWRGWPVTRLDSVADALKLVGAK